MTYFLSKNHGYYKFSEFWFCFKLSEHKSCDKRKKNTFPLIFQLVASGRRRGPRRRLLKRFFKIEFKISTSFTLEFVLSPQITFPLENGFVFPTHIPIELKLDKKKIKSYFLHQILPTFSTEIGLYFFHIKPCPSNLFKSV